MLARGGGTRRPARPSIPRWSSTARSTSTACSSSTLGRRCVVEPGIVLDELNRRPAARAVVPGRHLDLLARHHRRHGRQQFRGARSLRYGNTRENVISVDAVLGWRGGAFRPGGARPLRPARDLAALPLARDLLALGAREADAIQARFPRVQRRVGGYNIDALVPGRNELNLAHILVTLKERSASRPGSSPLSPLIGAARSAPATRRFPTGDGRRQYRQARADRGRVSSTAPCSAWRARSPCSSRPSTRSCAATRRPSCSSSSPRTIPRRTSAGCCGSTR